jgi:hypothetical protein
MRVDHRKYPVLAWHCAIEPKDVKATTPVLEKFKDCFEIREALAQELTALMRECEERGRQKERRRKTRR